MEDDTETTKSGWVGWIVFAAVLMILHGLFQTFAGISAIFSDTYLLASVTGLYLFDATGWGWIHLIWGIIVVLAGFALLQGSTWARFLAVVVAGISTIPNLGFVNTYPIWSLIIVLIDILIIYAVVTHGQELKNVE